MRIGSITRLTGSNAYVSTHSTDFYCIRLHTCICPVRFCFLPLFFPFAPILLAPRSLRTGIIVDISRKNVLTCVNANEVDEPKRDKCKQSARNREIGSELSI